MVLVEGCFPWLQDLGFENRHCVGFELAICIVRRTRGGELCLGLLERGWRSLRERVHCLWRSAHATCGRGTVIDARLEGRVVIGQSYSDRLVEHDAL